MSSTWFAENPGTTFLLFLSLIALLILLSKTFRYIPNNRVGIVEKLISGKGSVKTGFIAMNGEAGFQPQILRGGWHLLTPFQYRIHKMPLVTIPQGKSATSSRATARISPPPRRWRAMCAPGTSRTPPASSRTADRRALSA